MLVGKAFCLRNQDWTYVWRQYEDEELYDRQRDPAETCNVAGVADAALLNTLRAQLFHWLADTSDVVPWQADPRFPPIPHGQHTPFD
jgi:hypothetical protein